MELSIYFPYLSQSQNTMMFTKSHILNYALCFYVYRVPVASSRQLARGNVFLFASSGAHLALCFLLVQRYGAVGLVWASAANMALRSAYSLAQIQSHFRALDGFSLGASLPRRSDLQNLSSAPWSSPTP